MEYWELNDNTIDGYLLVTTNGGTRVLIEADLSQDVLEANNLLATYIEIKFRKVRDERANKMYIQETLENRSWKYKS